MPTVSSARVQARTTSNRWIAWDITEAVRHWVSEPEENFGLALRLKDAADAPKTTWRFFASEALQSRRDGLGGGARLAYRPMLIVTPAP